MACCAFTIYVPGSQSSAYKIISQAPKAAAYTSPLARAVTAGVSNAPIAAPTAAVAAYANDDNAATLRPSSVHIHGRHPNYGGHCTLCSSSHWLPCTPEAVAELQQLLCNIHQHQRLDFDSSSAPDPRFHMDYLFTKGPGRMLGVMLAADAAGNTHVLRAFSGQITESWHIPGWVGPVAGLISTSPMYVRTRRVIEGLSARLHALDAHQQQQQQPHQHADDQQQLVASERRQQQQQRRRRQPQDKQQSTCVAGFQQQQRQLLKRRRRSLSHHLLQQIQQSYLTTTVGGHPQLSLVNVYLNYRQQHDRSLPVTKAGVSFVGMPAGAGDCCAPKLLHAASQLGLRPLALAEVWFGSAPGTATPAKNGRGVSSQPAGSASSRQHCRLYGPCEKCSALLGTMLCPGVANSD